MSWSSDVQEHKWVDEPSGPDGTWSQCSGCGKKVHFPAKWNAFQRRITITMAWMNDVLALSKEDEALLETARTYSTSPEALNPEIGVHGLLAVDCDFARSFDVLIVMMR